MMRYVIQHLNLSSTVFDLPIEIASFDRIDIVTKHKADSTHTSKTYAFRKPHGRS